MIKSSTISSSGDRSIPCLGSTVILITAGLRKKCEYDSVRAKVIASEVQSSSPNNNVAVPIHGAMKKTRNVNSSAFIRISRINIIIANGTLSKLSDGIRVFVRLVPSLRFDLISYLREGTSLRCN